MKRLIASLIFVCVGPLFAEAQTFHTNCVSASPTVDTGGAYASGDVIGTQLAFTNLFRSSVGTGYITSVCIADKAAQAVDLDLVPLRSGITSATGGASTVTDQAAFDPADADLSKVLPPINFGSTSRFAFNDNSVHCVDSKAIAFKASSSVSGTLYAVLVARGAYTGASASDITVTVCASQD